MNPEQTAEVDSRRRTRYLNLVGQSPAFLEAEIHLGVSSGVEGKVQAIKSRLALRFSVVRFRLPIALVVFFMNMRYLDIFVSPDIPVA